MDIRSRRTALGLSRRDLALLAKMDSSVVQLVELGQWADDDARVKLEALLSDLEKARTTPKADEN